MKHCFKLVAFSLLVLSCSWHEFETEKFQGDIKENRVTKGDISAYLKTCKGIDGLTKAADAVEVTPVLNGPDTVMYIVNYEEGWDVLSADKRAPVVLMTCDSGHATEDILYSNPAQTEFVEEVKNAMSELISDSSAPVVSESDNWGGISVMSSDPNEYTPWVKVGTQLDHIDTVANQNHLLKTHWGQSGIWNIKAPYQDSLKRTHCPTGCVMVAGSQVLYYLHYKFGFPAKIYGDCTCSAFIPEGSSNVTLNDSNISFDENTYSDIYWDLMPLDRNSGTSYDSYGYVSSLMSRIGYLISANYGKTTTTAFTSRLSSAYRDEFSIDSKIEYDYNIDLIREQILDKKIPCLLDIIQTGNAVGHAVIVDGCRYLRYHTRVYYRRYNQYNSSVRYEIETSYKNFWTINWGWDGTGDYDYSTKETIWYNAEIIKWRNYDKFNFMLYDFQPLDN